MWAMPGLKLYCIHYVLWPKLRVCVRARARVFVTMLMHVARQLCQFLCAA